MQLVFLTGAVTAVILTCLYVIKQWLNGSRCNSRARLDGKTVLITGANAGIGKETAVDLAKRGATVVIACRDVCRGKNALNEIMERSASSNVHLRILDLASMLSIQKFSCSFLSEFNKLHVLINNAGVMLCPYMKTKEGFELQLGVNHIGHFALTALLYKRMVESSPSRIINISSLAHQFINSYIGTRFKFDDINSEFSYNAMQAYAQSKLANVLFTKELNRKIAGNGVTTYAVHPGCVCTDLYRHVLIGKVFNSAIGLLVGKSPEQGAQTSIYCAVEEGIESESGMYFSDCAVKASSKESNDKGMAKKLWEMSEEMSGVKFPFEQNSC